MSGICGIVSLDGSALMREQLSAMIALLDQQQSGRTLRAYRHCDPFKISGTDFARGRRGEI